MTEKKFYDKDDCERIDFIIKTLGESKRQMKLDYVRDVANHQHPYKVKKYEQESWQYYNCMINWLVEDVKLLRKYDTLVELTEEGMRLYEENIRIEAYIKNIREEKRLAIRKLKLGITYKWILIVSALFALSGSLLSHISDDFWSNLLNTFANFVLGALVAIACQLVKPIRKFFNPYGID